MRINFLKKLKDFGLPESVITIFIVMLGIFVLSRFFSGSDFGIFKIPKLPQYLFWIGIIFLIFLFVPIFSSPRGKQVIDSLNLELKMIKSKISEFDENEKIHAIYESKKEKGLRQNPFMCYVEPLSRKFLNNRTTNRYLPKWIRKEIEMLVINSNQTIKDTKMVIDRILRRLNK